MELCLGPAAESPHPAAPPHPLPAVPAAPLAGGWRSTRTLSQDPSEMGQAVECATPKGEQL